MLKKACAKHVLLRAVDVAKRVKGEAPAAEAAAKRAVV
jgi:hypothetical protein